MDIAGFNAKNAREKAIAAGKYKEWTYEEVVEAIHKKAEEGKMELNINPGYISPKTLTALAEAGFWPLTNISVIHEDMPMFWIRWDGHYPCK